MTAKQDIIDPELDVLQNIYAHADHVRQRDLAKIAGLSLGMTNAVVKRLVQKGWLTIRKVNNRNIMYVVSPEGIEQITRRSYRYFKRTIKNIVYYREAIEKFVCWLKDQGYRTIVLAGASDLDFIVEHACVSSGIHYSKEDVAFDEAYSRNQKQTPFFLLYSETYIADDEEKRRAENVAFLQEILSLPNMEKVAELSKGQ
jgi:DNA-binding MarR family transcriptional regulator